MARSNRSRYSLLYHPARPDQGVGGCPHPSLFERWDSAVRQGNVKFSVALEQGSTNTYDGGNCGEFAPRTDTSPSPAAVGQGIIAGDGYVYFPYLGTITSVPGDKTGHGYHSRDVGVSLLGDAG
jgi:hypothetical protein